MYPLFGGDFQITKADAIAPPGGTPPSPFAFFSTQQFSRLCFRKAWRAANEVGFAKQSEDVEGAVALKIMLLYSGAVCPSSRC